jgi:hypothetical protein
LAVHGMQSNAAWFHSGSYLAEQGIEVLAFDRRGSGMSLGARGHVEDFSHFVQDMSGALEFLRNRRKDVPIHVHANCFGTRIAIPYMQDYMERETRAILQAEYQEQNPSARPDELEDISGFKFASVINTSPATHMSVESESRIRSRMDCFIQIMTSASWEQNQGCSTKPFEQLEILEKGIANLTPTELRCFTDFAQADRTRFASLPCEPEHIEKILDPARSSDLNEDEKRCLDEAVFINYENSKRDACSANDRQELRGSGRDPSGTNLFRTPLHDEMFTTEPRFLDLIKRDGLAAREFSRAFFFAVNSLTDAMNRWLLGQSFAGRIIESPFTGSVLMVLSKHDVMVNNDDIVHQYFSALRASPAQKPGDTNNLCYLCNPKVVGGDFDKSACNPASLLACKFPEGSLECGTAGVRELSSCTEPRLITVRNRRFQGHNRAQKRLVELDCEHFMDFCKDRNETQRYRVAMRDWLLDERWQNEWRENFE